jgi:hypothetical protein
VAAKAGVRPGMIGIHTKSLRSVAPLTGRLRRVGLATSRAHAVAALDAQEQGSEGAGPGSKGSLATGS